MVKSVLGVNNPLAIGTMSFDDGTVGNPSVDFVLDNDTGFYRAGSGITNYTSNGVNTVTLGTGGVTATRVFATSLGTQAAPSFSFSTETNTGIYNIGAGTIAMTVSGSRKCQLTTSAFEMQSHPFRYSNGSAATPSSSFTSATDSGFYYISATALGMSVGGVLRTTFSTSQITCTLPILLPSTGSSNNIALSYSASATASYSLIKTGSTDIFSPAQTTSIKVRRINTEVTMLCDGFSGTFIAAPSNIIRIGGATACMPTDFFPATAVYTSGLLLAEAGVYTACRVWIDTDGTMKIDKQSGANFTGLATCQVFGFSISYIV